MNLEEVLVLRLNSEDAKFRIGRALSSDGHRSIYIDESETPPIMYFDALKFMCPSDSVIGRILVDGNDVIVKIGRGQSIFNRLVFMKGFPISLPAHKMVTYRFDIGDPEFPENVISLINDSIQTGLDLYAIYIQRSQGCFPVRNSPSQ